MLSWMLTISHAFYTRLYPFKQDISLHVTVTGTVEDNVEIWFLYWNIFDILQLQFYITNKNLYADGMKWDDMHWRYGEYSIQLREHITVSHQYLTRHTSKIS